KAITIGLTIRDSSSPNLSHSRLRGWRAAGRATLAARNSAESVTVHGQSSPECHAFSALTAANAPAITNPNERSDPVTIFSSRKNVSCVVCPAFDSSLRLIMPSPIFQWLSFYALQTVPESRNFKNLTLEFHH